MYYKLLPAKGNLICGKDAGIFADAVPAFILIGSLIFIQTAKGSVQRRYILADAVPANICMKVYYIVLPAKGRYSDIVK